MGYSIGNIASLLYVAIRLGAQRGLLAPDAAGPERSCQQMAVDMLNSATLPTSLGVLLLSPAAGCLDSSASAYQELLVLPPLPLLADEVHKLQRGLSARSAAAATAMRTSAGTGAGCSGFVGNCGRCPRCPLRFP